MFPCIQILLTPFYSTGLVIPPPPQEVPFVTNTSETPQQDNTTNNRVRKADLKELAASSSLTARYIPFRPYFSLFFISTTPYRSLYAEEYRKSHPGVTVGEFRAVWDAVDKETRKVCECRHPYCYFFSFNDSLDLRKNVQGQESGGYPQQRRYQCP